MGTPQFAVSSLENLLQNDEFEIVGVITSPDKPAGRGRKMQMSDVKKFALEQNLKILQPTNLKDEVFLSELKALEADLFVVVAFRMLPKAVWQMPPKGTINLHASLLPQYRGAAPINWAIINGETKTGLTTFFIEEKIDTGKIIDQKEIQISETDSAGTLHDKLMHDGAKLLTETVKKIKNNTYSETKQEQLIEGEIKSAPKIFKDTCKINWNKPITQIYNFIRGLSPYPAAWTEVEVEGKVLIAKIFHVKVEKIKKKNKLPIIETDNKNYLKIALTDGLLEILEIQLQGKKRLNIKQFLNGFDATKLKIAINH